MMWKQAKRIGLVAAAGLMVVPLAGNAGTAKAATLAKNQTFKMMVPSELTTMDNSKMTDIYAATVLNNTNEGLYRLTSKNKAVPALATSVVKSTNNGLEYTFHLRHSKWSNGDPVTAKDFVYSWQRTVNPKTASQYAFLFEGIKNATAIADGKKQPSELGVKAVDDYTLQVTMDKPVPYFDLLMANPTFYPQNQKVVEKYGSKYGTTSAKQVYNGPFKLTKWNGTSLKWTLVKNKDYWDKSKVKLNKIEYQAVKDPSTALNLYQSKDLDDVTLSSEMAKQSANNKDKVIRKMASTFYLEYNQKKVKAFQNKKIRQAISLTVDRQKLAKNVLADGSTAAKGYVPDGLANDPKNGKDFASEAQGATEKAAVDYNMKKAKKLWAEGKKEVGIKKLNVELMGDDTDASKKILEYLQNGMEKLPGLKVTNQNLPFKTRLSRSESGKFDMVMTAWNGDFGDPITFMDLLTSTNSYNNGKWSNASYDKDVSASKNENAANPDARWQNLLDAENTLMSDEGVAPIYQKNEFHLVNSKVKGIVYHQTGASYDYKTAYIAK
ncbi:peptide ABC transporter substrate-binding protein [Loigolactobacillus coryniformis subsp. torquens DSM 20004 = KCTC 3535]|uniref:Oligopeptide ABC transporter, substrate binding protein n=3 Tax=Loigolactobacillus coryniformis TaxID=1610 RepID=J3JC19_9LACO|nr:peptide ABC transporter substrate-binding protein [Loigolactobacillus coryniformis]ATO43244.1 peptide ABC transporter substrate-binding protein [Loigolactobacillus coryniformis subsp. torquens DSM 20004 = KCTC 3535]EJN56202.1 Oligopeptide ABC transporter, substrate binding protein [Loigolactobacillus coryniformis subsp. coryniformis CECT 5711]